MNSTVVMLPAAESLTMTRTPTMCRSTKMLTLNLRMKQALITLFNSAGGLKATINNPQVSQEAKDSAKERLEGMNQ